MAVKILVLCFSDLFTGVFFHAHVFRFFSRALVLYFSRKEYFVSRGEFWFFFMGLCFLFHGHFFCYVFLIWSVATINVWSYPFREYEEFLTKPPPSPSEIRTFQQSFYNILPFTWCSINQFDSKSFLGWFRVWARLAFCKHIQFVD